MRIFISAYILLSSIISFGQEDPLFSNLTPTYAVSSAGFPEGRIDTFYEHQNSDTIDDVIWNKVYRFNYKEDGTPYESNFIKFLGYIRREQQKAFYKGGTFFDNREGLMHDFTLLEGDTTSIVAYRNYYPSDTLTYISYVVDSILNVNCIDGGTRKIMYLHSLSGNGIGIDWQFIWIEGLGDSYHPYLPTTCIDGSGAACDIYHRPYTIFNGSNWITSDELPCNLTSINSDYLTTYTLKVYPNPVNINDKVIIENSRDKIFSIEIITLNGQHVFLEENIFRQLYELDLSRLKQSPGIVFCRIIMENNKTHLVKLIVN